MLLLTRLEVETAAYHRDADQPWRELLSPTLTRAQYAALLTRAYGVEASLETAFAHAPHLESAFEPRPRARLIARDLFALDYGRFGALPRASIEPFGSLADACGWLYAVERSARLFPMIAGNVLARLPHLHNAVALLDDREASERWKSFGAVLDRIAHTPRIAAQIMESAHTALRALNAWYAPVHEAMRAGA